MGTRDAVRVGAGERWTESPAPGRASGPRAAMRATLARMSYAEQVEAVRPAVQMSPALQKSEETAVASAASNGGAPEGVPPVPARINHLLGDREWADLWRLSHPDGRFDDAGAVAALERLFELLAPRLVHGPGDGALGNYEDPHRRLAPHTVEGGSGDGEQWWVDGCHESAYIVQEAASSLRIDTDVIWMGSHRTASFPGLGNLALFHGDDLHSGRPLELAPLGVVEEYWRQAADLALMGSLLPEPGDPEFLRQLFEDALPDEPVMVPGAGGQVFSVRHQQWLERVSDALLGAVVAYEDVNVSTLRRIALADLRDRVTARVQEWAAGLNRLGSISAPSDGAILSSTNAIVAYVLPDGRLPQTTEEALGTLVRRVEAGYIAGAMMAELIPQAQRRALARERGRQE